MKTVIAICLGASTGALLRWRLGLKLNSLLPALPPGTLAANPIGGCVIGVAKAHFATAPSIPTEWRWLIITGFYGGLTTFSTFSAEVVALLQRGRLALAGGTVAVRVIGSITMTLLGIGPYAWVAGT